MQGLNVSLRSGVFIYMDMKSTQTKHWPIKSLLLRWQHDGRETVAEGMYESPPPRFVFIKVYWDFAKFRNVGTTWSILDLSRDERMHELLLCMQTSTRTLVLVVLSHMSNNDVYNEPIKGRFYSEHVHVWNVRVDFKKHNLRIFGEILDYNDSFWSFCATTSVRRLYSISYSKFFNYWANHIWFVERFDLQLHCWVSLNLLFFLFLHKLYKVLKTKTTLPTILSCKSAVSNWWTFAVVYG